MRFLVRWDRCRELKPVLLVANTASAKRVWRSRSECMIAFFSIQSAFAASSSSTGRGGEGSVPLDQRGPRPYVVHGRRKQRPHL